MKKEKQETQNIEKDHSLSTNDENDNVDNKVAELETSLASEKERALMALADLENYKKRVQKEREEMNLLANAATFSLLLEVMDDLARAISQMNEPPVGLTMIGDKIKNLLKEQGIEEVEIKEGDNFDPKIMQGVGTVTVNEEEKNNKIIHVDQKAYKLSDKDLVIRPAKVIVGKK